MPDFKVSIENLKEVQAAYQRYPNVLKGNLNTAIRKSIFKIQIEATNNARTMMNVITGRLLNSIGESIKFGELYGQIGSDIVDPPYPFFLHEGTRFITARPWLSTAVDTVKPATDQFFIDAVQATNDDFERTG